MQNEEYEELVQDLAAEIYDLMVLLSRCLAIFKQHAITNDDTDGLIGEIELHGVKMP